jgi:predicted MFS family arabinose efflux permease
MTGPTGPTGPTATGPVDDTRPPARRSVLKDAAFRRLWTGISVSKLGSSVAGVATPLIALQSLHASALTVSLLTAAAWLPWLLIGLPAGAWLDRVAKRPVMLACDAVAALLVLSVPAAAWLWHLTIVHLLAVALLVGTATVFFQIAYTAYLPAMFERDDLIRANAVLQGSESAVQIAGPGLGGALVAAVSAVAGLLVDGVSFVVSFVSLLLVRRPERPVAAAQRRSIGRDIVQGARWLAREPFLRTIMVHGAVSNLALTGYGAIIIVFLVRDVGVGTGLVGVLLAGSGLGGVAAASATPRLVRRFGSARALIVCKVAAGLSALLIPLTSGGLGLLPFVLGSALVAGFVVAGNVIGGSFRQAYVPAVLLGRVVTSMQFVNLGAIPLGALLGGTLATLLGTRTAIVAMTVTYALAGLIVVFSPLRGRRDLPERRTAANADGRTSVSY